MHSPATPSYPFADPKRVDRRLAATKRRSRAYRARLAREDLIPSRSASWCQTAAGHSVRGSITRGGNMHASGIKRCASLICSVCGPVVREKRSRELDLASSIILGAGGSAVFVTVTLPHVSSDPVRQTVDAVLKAWSLTWSGRGAAEFRASTGYIGMARALEVTEFDPRSKGRDNGAHPHVHALLFFDRPVTPSAVRSFMRPRWRSAVESTIGRTPGRSGLDVREVTDSSAVAGYLCKVEGGWGAGLELGRADLKKRAGRLSMPQLLELASMGDLDATSRWVELERALYGRTIMRWSKGLRAKVTTMALALVDHDDPDVRSSAFAWLEEFTDYQSDEDLISTDADDVVFERDWSADVWNLAVAHGREHELLEELLAEAFRLGLVEAPPP